MKRHRIILILAILSVIAGCGTPKYISRDRADYQDDSRVEESAVNSPKSPGAEFDGRLNLLYEKKIKGTADSPLMAVSGMIAFNSTRQRILGFDQATGKKIFQIKKRRGFVFNPVVSDSLLIVVLRSRFGQVQVRNLFTGKVITERTINEIRSGPIIVSGNLIFGTVDGLLSLSLPNLETRWWIKNQEIVDIPAVAGSEAVYYASGHTLLAIKAEGGQRLWKKECKAAIVSELSLGSHLFVALADNTIIAIDKKSGETIWDRVLEFPVHGGVSQNDQRIYFGCTDGKVYCLSAADGEHFWDYQTEGIVTAAPIVYGQAVLVGSQDRYFYSLDRTDGGLIDRHQLEGPVTLTAAVDNDHIYVACRKNRLYCFEGIR